MTAFSTLINDRSPLENNNNYRASQLFATKKQIHGKKIKKEEEEMLQGPPLKGKTKKNLQ